MVEIITGVNKIDIIIIKDFRMVKATRISEMNNNNKKINKI